MMERQPTHFDQLMLELINRARLNPQAEADRLINGELNEGIPSELTISLTPKQPLAFNLHLNQAAKDHSDWMLINNIFSHRGINGTSSQQRMAIAGYDFDPPWGSGENIAWKGTTGTFNSTDYVIDNYEALFIDEDYPNRGHRVAIMKDEFQEIGISSRQGKFTANGVTYNTVMTTQNFAYSDNDGAFLTGVIYTDAIVDDDFYTIGEGIGNITITARKINSGETFTTENWNTGGYSLQLPNGDYQVDFVGNLDQDPQDDIVSTNITINQQNIKFDLLTDDPNLAQPLEPEQPIEPTESEQVANETTPELEPTPELELRLNPEPTSAPQPSLESLLQSPLYRFQNQDTEGTYLYAGETESQTIRQEYPQFQEEGFAFFVGMSPDDELTAMYRFQNQDIEGTYLYAGETESQIIREEYDNFDEEGLAFYVYGAGSDLGVPIYRLQNLDRLGTYLFVTEQEKNNVLANYSNFENEGIAFNVET